jgi:hypothetical protein
MSDIPADTETVCSLCHVVLSTEGCDHLADLGDGRIVVKRSSWESLVEDRWALRRLMAADE